MRQASDRRSKHDQSPSPPSARSRWSLDAPLLSFSDNDHWTIGHACEGTQIFGATGSGKTTGSGRFMAMSKLRAGFGGLVLCAKTDEASHWEKLAAASGRAGDVIRFGAPGASHGLNFLDYEARRPGAGAGETENIVNVLMQVAELASQKYGNARGDDFWERTMKQMLRNAVEIIKQARGQVSLIEIAEVVHSAPQSMEQIRSEDWKRGSPCFQYLLEGEKKVSQDKEHETDFQLAAKYWLKEFPQLADRTRSVIVACFTSLADAFLRGKLRNLFCGTTNVVPELCQQGAVTIIDLPIKEHAEVGQYGQVLFKYLFQKAMERRQDNGAGEGRPVFLWADESHFFTTKYDALFQSTARAAKVATVYLTQNLPNYFETMGGDESGRARVQSLLGNLQTKIFHQNSEPETNRYSAEVIGKILQMRMSAGGGESRQFMNFPTESSSFNMAEHMDYDLQPREFTTLAKGGAEHDHIVEGIVFQGGRTFSTGKTWLKTRFQQTLL